MSLQGSPHHPDQVVIEAAERVLGGLSFRTLLIEMGPHRGMHPRLSKHHLMKGCVQLAVAHAPIRSSRCVALQRAEIPEDADVAGNVVQCAFV